MIPVAALFVVLSAANVIVAENETWPVPEMLVGFWPFDEKSTLPSSFVQSGDLRLATDVTGLLGQPNTSYTVAQDDTSVGHIEVGEVASITSWITLSMFVHSKLIGTGGLLELSNGHDSPTIALKYSEPDQLHLLGYQQNGSYEIGRFPILSPNKWNFLAVTYRRSTKTLSIHNQSGEAVRKVTKVALRNENSTRLFFGEVFSEPGKIAKMKRTDALHCVMLYMEVLMPQEIAKLPQVCLATISRSFWPRPESLLGLWPFDETTMTSNIAPNNTWLIPIDPSWVVTSQTGPFGHPRSCYSVSKDSASIGVVENLSSGLDSFTISFYIQSRLKSEVSVLSLQDESNKTRYSVNLVEPNFLQLIGPGWSGSLFQITHSRQVKRGMWNFVAITIDLVEGLVKSFDEFGVIRSQISAPPGHRIGRILIGESKGMVGRVVTLKMPGLSLEQLQDRCWVLVYFRSLVD